MTIAHVLLAEFEQEAPTTRKFLERLPDDKLDWRAHPKSMTAGQLAFHMAEFPGNVVQMAQAEKFTLPDLRRENHQPTSTQEILTTLDGSIATVRQVLPTFTDEQLQGLWTLAAGGRDLLTMPRLGVLRSILLNHWYHHRGQLGVYLRLLGAQVPSAYGPSGDELPDFLK